MHVLYINVDVYVYVANYKNIFLILCYIHILGTFKSICNANKMQVLIEVRTHIENCMH